MHKTFSKYFVPWDDSTQAYLIPEIPFQDELEGEGEGDGEVTIDYAGYSLDEIFTMLNEYLVVKSEHKRWNDICNYEKIRLSKYLEDNHLDEVVIGEFGVALQTRTSMRLDQGAIPLELAAQYTIKTKSYSYSFYRQSDIDAISERERKTGMDLLKKRETKALEFDLMEVITD